MMNYSAISTAMCILILTVCSHAGPISRVPIIINKPGKYYLIKNVSPANRASGGAAIQITASNVELDFAGFSVIANPEAPGVDAGITVGSGDYSVRVRNGRIDGFTTGVQISGQTGNLLLEYLEIRSPSTGVHFYGGTTTRIRGCGFILTSDSGRGLRATYQGGPVLPLVIESCSFSATTSGVAATQIGLETLDNVPMTVRDCQFIGWGQGIKGTPETIIANNLFLRCGTTFTGSTSVGFNQ